MKTNRKMHGRKGFFVIPITLLLLMGILISSGTTFGKYSKEIKLSPTWSIEIPGSGGGGDVVKPSGGDDGPGIVEETPNTVYQVQPGDTLSAIAKKFHTTVEALVAYNQLENADFIQAGMILRIPPADYVITETHTDKAEETNSTKPTEDTDPTDTTAMESSLESSETSKPDASKNHADPSGSVQESEFGTETEETSVSTEPAPADGSIPADDVTNDETE